MKTETMRDIWNVWRFNIAGYFGLPFAVMIILNSRDAYWYDYLWLYPVAVSGVAILFFALTAGVYAFARYLHGSVKSSWLSYILLNSAILAFSTFLFLKGGLVSSLIFSISLVILSFFYRIIHRAESRNESEVFQGPYSMFALLKAFGPFLMLNAITMGVFSVNRIGGLDFSQTGAFFVVGFISMFFYMAVTVSNAFTLAIIGNFLPEKISDFIFPTDSYVDNSPVKSLLTPIDNSPKPFKRERTGNVGYGTKERRRQLEAERNKSPG